MSTHFHLYMWVMLLYKISNYTKWRSLLQVPWKYTNHHFKYPTVKRCKSNGLNQPSHKRQASIVNASASDLVYVWNTNRTAEKAQGTMITFTKAREIWYTILYLFFWSCTSNVPDFYIAPCILKFLIYQSINDFHIPFVYLI